jgi:hypothetical protein
MLILYFIVESYSKPEIVNMQVVSHGIASVGVTVNSPSISSGVSMTFLISAMMIDVSGLY